jgi:hypothetical protein
MAPAEAGRSLDAIAHSNRTRLLTSCIHMMRLKMAPKKYQYMPVEIKPLNVGGHPSEVIGKVGQVSFVIFWRQRDFWSLTG